MKRIETLSSLEGRNTLRDIYFELKFKKQLSGLATLFLCLKICISEKEIFRYVKKDITVLHPLGFFSGIGLWMEEIVNRYYFSTINSFVYFGAAVLLTLIGIRRFSDTVSDTVVITGIAFEAAMLCLIFIVMLFSPSQDTEDYKDDSNEDATVQDLIIEIGEIGRDIAAVVVQLEKLSDSYIQMANLQKELINQVSDVAKSTAQAISPNPKMLETMTATNEILVEFKNTVDNLNKSTETLKHEEIEFAVRKEVERIIVNNLIKNG